MIINKIKHESHDRVDGFKIYRCHRGNVENSHHFTLFPSPHWKLNPKAFDEFLRSISGGPAVGDFGITYSKI